MRRVKSPRIRVAAQRPVFLPARFALIASLDARIAFIAMRGRLFLAADSAFRVARCRLATLYSCARSPD
ncbi:hypothetical protein BN2475_50037 [Paraburkholderia ribeironis]|uniref:Uncharacterized protein n=1 Tax=Paraburkholderia ribeironis TaxID=1247936 RepID=A0A1N7RK26_9BURK|nr:hypothetical protein BN2475_50037 [Paraburkholderia ribeironis]